MKQFLFEEFNLVLKYSTTSWGTVMAASILLMLTLRVKQEELNYTRLLIGKTSKQAGTQTYGQVDR